MTMNKLMILLLCTSCFTLASCGKRGDLLPPAGYEAPSENNS